MAGCSVPSGTASPTIDAAGAVPTCVVYEFARHSGIRPIYISSRPQSIRSRASGRSTSRSPTIAPRRTGRNSLRPAVCRRVCEARVSGPALVLRFRRTAEPGSAGAITDASAWPIARMIGVLKFRPRRRRLRRSSRASSLYACSQDPRAQGNPIVRPLVPMSLGSRYRSGTGNPWLG